MILLLKQNVKLSQVRVSVVRVLCAAGMQLGGMCTGPLVGVWVWVGVCVSLSKNTLGKEKEKRNLIVAAFYTGSAVSLRSVLVFILLVDCSVLQQLVDQVDVCQHHSSAAVPSQPQCIKCFTVPVCVSPPQKKKKKKKKSEMDKLGEHRRR